MRVTLLAAALTILFFSAESSAQLNNGTNRLKAAASNSVSARKSRYSLPVNVGHMLTRSVELELGADLLLGGIALRTGAVYHLQPESKIIPGAGLSIGILIPATSLYTSLLINTSINLDTFIAKNWTLCGKVGHEREYRGSCVGDTIYDRLFFQVGLSPLFGYSAQ